MTEGQLVQTGIDYKVGPRLHRIWRRKCGLSLSALYIHSSLSGGVWEMCNSDDAANILTTLLPFAVDDSQLLLTLFVRRRGVFGR